MGVASMMGDFDIEGYKKHFSEEHAGDCEDFTVAKLIAEIERMREERKADFDTAHIAWNEISGRVTKEQRRADYLAALVVKLETILRSVTDGSYTGGPCEESEEALAKVEAARKDGLL